MAEKKRIDLLVARNPTKSFGHQTVIDDLSLRSERLTENQADLFLWRGYPADDAGIGNALRFEGGEGGPALGFR